MSLTDVGPEVRADWFAALGALLERGIIVEPIRESRDWTSYPVRVGWRIRLADEQQQDESGAVEVRPPGELTNAW